MRVVVRTFLSVLTPFASVLPLASIIPFANAGGPRGTPFETTRASVATDGTQGNNTSGGVYRSIALGAESRIVVFLSQANNLVSADTNDSMDVFVRDRDTGETTRVSVAFDGAQANDLSYSVSASRNGRFIAFDSRASNLVPDDTNGVADVFVHDRESGEITRVSVASDGSQGNEQTLGSMISADGRFVAFASLASNLVPNDTNSTYDIFVHELATGITTRVNVAMNGSEANAYSADPSISGDGRYVVFDSDATNLFGGDTNTFCDVYIHDRLQSRTRAVTSNVEQGPSNGDSYAPVVSEDGSTVAYMSEASNLVPGDTNNRIDVFVYQRMGQLTSIASVRDDGVQANGPSALPSISADGAAIAFYSNATNLATGDANGTLADVFVHDRFAGTTILASVASDGAGGNLNSSFPVVSANGQSVAFSSAATNLTPGDTNGLTDVFVVDLHPAPVMIPGDTNGDNVVNFTDLNIVLSNFGQTGPGLDGDVNDDDSVNFTDLNIVLANFGMTAK
jgi:Tol biopolymer transport system component